MSFLSPLFLAGLLGLFLPWALHRFSNQDPEERAFPSVRFLEATTPPVSRKRRLRYRLLFALRMLALALLCLLFAEPWLDRLDSNTQAQHLHIIALDKSFSMQRDERWERARTVAQEQLDALPDGDFVRLISFDNSVTSYSEATRIPADLHSILNGLTPGFAPGDYGVLMQWLDNMAEESELPVLVYVITDAQRAALPQRVNALAASRLEALNVVDVGAEQDTNISVAADARTLDDVTARIRINVRASIASAQSSDETLPMQTVIVRHKERILAREQITLVAGEQQSILFDQIALPNTSEPVFEIALEPGDELSGDDVVQSIVRQPKALTIALGALEGDVDSNAEAFVSTALQTDGEAEIDNSAGALDNLSKQSRYAVSADALADVGEASIVGKLDDSHQLALGSIHWGGLRFHESRNLDLQDNDRVLMETSDRTPLLVEREVPRGSLLLLNDPLDGKESNLPFHPGFVSLLQNILEHFSRNAAIPDEVTVGSSVALPGNIQILDPAGEKLLDLAALSDAQNLEFERPGLHTVLDSRGEHRLSVVLDPDEGDMSALSEQEKEAWQSGGTKAAEVDSTSINADEKPLADTAQKSSTAPLSGYESDTALALWPWLLPILVLLMFGETLLANQRLQVRRDGS